jgi:threonine/homoserine/homoserine lactone efflux protein
LRELINFIYGYVYGLSLAMPPGPMNALIADRSLYSFRAGFLTGLGALSADVIFMILTIFFYELMKNSAATPLIFFIGGGYMMFLVIEMIRGWRNDINIDPEKRRSSSNLVKTYLTSLLLGITNPYQILWWATAGLSLIAILGLSVVIGLLTAILTWIIIFPLMIRAGYRVNKRTTIYVIKIFSIIVLITFSLLLLYNGFKEIINLITS